MTSVFGSAEKPRRLQVFLTISLLISIVALGSFAALAWGPISIPLEVKDPLEILDYPSGFSLYPGETANFEITVQNHASVTYFVEFDFRLNDTEYQAEYVTFSNYNYSVVAGTQKLSAWLTIAPTAPPANLMLTIDRKTDTPTPTTSSNLSPSSTLLGAGARWAAREGKSALYVNWYDNWLNHSTTDGANWEWGSVSNMAEFRSSVEAALEEYGFSVTFTGDIPLNLENYDLVVLFAYYAIEPRHASVIGEYIKNGGAVVLLAGTPCYFQTYSKSMSPFPYAGLPPDFSSIPWLGARSYRNGGGTATLMFDYPLGTELTKKDVIAVAGLGNGALTYLDDDAQAIAVWNQPLHSWVTESLVFAFTHEYGAGRLYYQSTIDI